MPFVKNMAPLDALYERIEGGHILRTDASQIYFVPGNRTNCIELVDNGSVAMRSYLIRGDGFIALPAYAVYEFVQVDNSKTFKFEQLR